jgi:CheY-like chemotaxis protein
VLRIAERALAGRGYDVLTANSAPAALCLVDERDDIDVVLTDVLMPGMTGWELADAVAHRRPHASIGVMSGSGHASVPSDREDEPVLLLAKPFTVDELVVAADTLFARSASRR